MKKRISTGLAILGLLLAWPAAAAEFKFGYVSTERIYSEAKPAVLAQQRLEREFAQREQELKKLAARARDLQSHIEKMKPDDSERRNRERELAQLDREFQAKQREFREDLALRRNEEFAAVRDRANRAIRQLAAQDQFDLILQDAVYVSPRYDLTDRVLKELDK